MSFMFDLTSYEDVKEEAENILARLRDGTMPCDEPWPPERIQLMADWAQEGCPP